MDARFDKWFGARQLNIRSTSSSSSSGVDTSSSSSAAEQTTEKTACRYVVLLTDTQSFQVFRDLRRALRVTKKPNDWFVKKFRRHGVRVEYATVFTERETLAVGPAGERVSWGIAASLVRRHYDPEKTVLVWRGGDPDKKCHVSRFKCLAPESFVGDVLSKD